MSKLTQIKQVERILKEQGYISRNWAIDTRLSVRLGAIVFKLREQGYDIETVEEKSDTIYKLKTKRVEYYKIPATGEVIEKKIYV